MRQAALFHWLHHYNVSRPHDNLHGRPPASHLPSSDNLVKRRSRGAPRERTSEGQPLSRRGPLEADGRELRCVEIGRRDALVLDLVLEERCLHRRDGLDAQRTILREQRPETWWARGVASSEGLGRDRRRLPGVVEHEAGALEERLEPSLDRVLVALM